MLLLFLLLLLLLLLVVVMLINFNVLWFLCGTHWTRQFFSLATVVDKKKG